MIMKFGKKKLIKSITFAAEGDVSDIFSSENFREIVNTFSYKCEKMYMYTCTFFRENYREIEQLEHCLAQF